MTRETVSWIMAVRKYGIVTADEMFPDDDEPRPRRPARKLARRVLGVLCESSRYAKNPLCLLAAHLHRSLAQAQKACPRESVFA